MTPVTLDPAFTPRLYQQRIFARCMEGGNALVVLPTGLGKTLIAAMLAAYRLNKCPGSKIAFLAPTKPLVMQHQETLAGYLTLEPDRLLVLTGDIVPEKRRDAWTRATICFMTPQTLENDLSKGLYTLSDVSLLVVDEAHHAVGEYAYTTLARFYMEQSGDPKILAMTASPGASREKIDEIAGNLFINLIEVRDEKDPDVKPYVHATKIEWIKVELPPDFVDLVSSLQEEQDKVDKFIKEKALLSPGKDKEKLVNRMDYLTIIKEAQARLNAPGWFEGKQDLFTVIKIVSIGMKLSYAIELVETQGLGSLWKYMKGAKEEARKPDASASTRVFADIVFRKGLDKRVERLVDQGISHPKVGKLRDIVKSFLAGRDQSRVIVFSNYRATVSLIVDEFKDHGIERVERFVGQQSSKQEKGMNRKVQGETIDRFHSGDVQVLVATSVAEEGLDIGEVDLVVFYDVVPSAIRTIQRQGRTGRKRKGRVVVLIASGTRDEAYFHAGRYKQRKMKETLDEMKGSNRNGSLDDFGFDS